MTVADRIAASRIELKASREALREQFAAGLPAPRLLRQHAVLVDTAITHLWGAARMPETAALLAVGGYGRGELYPWSDVDILVLLPNGSSSDVESRTEEFLGLAWDSGIDIGHSVRTVDDCVLRAEDDITIQTSLLEARRITGNEQSARQLAAAIADAVQPQRFFRAKLLEQQQRHDRHGDTNLEPNIKEAPGGLRDLHNILWIARAGGIGLGWRDLVARDILLPQEAREIARQEHVLQDLRIRLHYLAGRREDRLVFDYQTMLARDLGLSDRTDRRASEQLMQRFYRTAGGIRQMNSVVQPNLGAILFPPRGDRPDAINERFSAVNELLAANDPDLFDRDPSAILESFGLLQDHHELKGFTAQTLRALWRARKRINPAFRRNPANAARFMRILQHPSRLVREMRRMHQHGVLGRYVPAFGRVVGQMQHDLYHVYTVDEHILRVVRNLRRFAVPELAHEFPLCSRLMTAFERQEVLYIAGLFHDIAKGRGGDHSSLGAVDARRFCRLHAIAPDDTDLVAWLVENHLVMSSTAQKQDLSDVAVIAAFARRCQTDRRLTALYLLTVADIRGTSPKVWNAWKGKLLEDLFLAARRVLGGETVTPESSVERRQRESLEKLRLYAIPDGAEQKLWSELDTTYFLRHDADEIAWHTRLLNYRVHTERPVVKSRLAPIGDGLQVLIYTPDQVGLFARICHFFESTGYDIVEAKVHTTRHGYALDSFIVLAPDSAASQYRDLMGYVEHELTDRIVREEPLGPPRQARLSRQLRHFPLTPEVSITPDERGTYMVLTIVAGDRPGLLYSIARILNAHDVSLHTAKVNTLGSRAEDTFLVTGRVLKDSRQVVRIEEALILALQTA
jgi:[protein-PII] uridylyltransferase